MLDRTRIRDIYAEAAAIPEGLRAEFLDKECVGDHALRAEVESLLAAVASRPDFMAEPTAGGCEKGSIPEAAGTRVGVYRLLEEIGQGGFGSVFMAQQESPIRRRVALKIIKLGMDTRAVIARFDAERQALAMMDHEHIAKVHDAGSTQSGRPYFVMELVQGDPITTYCDKANLTIEERLGVFVQVCRAVQHAHSKGVIHRDLKPNNILVSTQDGRPHAKVIDFGIAKATEHRLTEQTHFTEFRQMIGTPEYMSPEQAGGAPDVDARSDVYSLGALLYELLTGSTPFDAKELRAAAYAEIQRIIREVDPLKPSTRLSRLGALANVAALRRTVPNRLSVLVSGDLDWIAMKALDKDRGRRYDTASALATDVERYLGGEPVSAAPPSKLYQVRKFARRHRGLVTASGLIAAALVLGIIGTSRGMMAADRARDAARISADSATREAQQAKAISEFMSEILTSVDPDNGGADVRLLDVLSSASATASQRFAGYPLLEAEVRRTLGKAYLRLSMPDKSKQEFRGAQSLYVQSVGMDDVRSMSAQLAALHAEQDSGGAKLVEPQLDELLARMKRVLGDDDPLVLEAMYLSADVHSDRGRAAEAIRVLLLLKAHPRLANDEQMQIRILEGLFRAYRKTPGNADRDQQARFWRDLLPLGRELVERAARTWGETSLRTLQSRNYLAHMLYKVGEFRLSAEQSRAILANSSERLGECHHLRVLAWGDLALALMRDGDTAGAAEAIRRELACRRASPKFEPLGLLSTLQSAMFIFDRAGSASEGETVAREFVTECRKYGGHADTFRAELFIAGFVSMSGRFEEAEELLLPLAAQADAFAAPSKQYAQACVELARARHLTRRGRFEEAESCLARCVELRGDIRVGTDGDLPDDIVFAYIELYEAWKKPEKVREYQKLRQEAFGIAPR